MGRWPLIADRKVIMFFFFKYILGQFSLPKIFWCKAYAYICEWLSKVMGMPKIPISGYSNLICVTPFWVSWSIFPNLRYNSMRQSFLNMLCYISQQNSRHYVLANDSCLKYLSFKIQIWNQPTDISVLY